MTKISSRIKGLHALLKSEGFARKGRVWNRVDSEYIDVVNVQVSKSGDRCTVNLGVIDLGIYRACWDSEPPDFSKDEQCTVRTRLGILLTGHDRWWPLEDEAEWIDAIAAMESEGLAFIAKMHSAPAMEAFLRPSYGGLPRYPPEAISLALLRSRQGDESGACDLLTQLLNSTIGAWRTKVEIITEKNCKHLPAIFSASPAT